jgi:hypothetical protein
MFKTAEKKKFKSQEKKSGGRGVIKRKINSSVKKGKSKRVTEIHKNVKISSLNMTL